MKRRHILLAGVLAIAVGYGPAASASGATVEVHPAEGVYGVAFLVNSAGYTLYSFSKDHGAHDKCQRIKGCATKWPPLTVTEAPTAGPGVNAAMLGTITLRRTKQVQVTYDGHPLYRNSEDPKPAEVYYFGFKEFRGNWFGITPNGGRISSP